MGMHCRRALTFESARLSCSTRQFHSAALCHNPPTQTFYATIRWLISYSYDELKSHWRVERTFALAAVATLVCAKSVQFYYASSAVCKLNHVIMASDTRSACSARFTCLI